MDKSYTPRLEHKNPDTPWQALGLAGGGTCTGNSEAPCFPNWANK